MMKQRWGLDRNVLRPTPGDPWGVEQHHWNTGAEENQQLSPDTAIYNKQVIIFAQSLYPLLLTWQSCEHLSFKIFKPLIIMVKHFSRFWIKIKQIRYKVIGFNIIWMTGSTWIKIACKHNISVWTAKWSNFKFKLHNLIIVVEIGAFRWDVDHTEKVILVRMKQGLSNDNQGT